MKLLERIQLYVENDIFPFFKDLLHLLMKFAAVRSVRVREYNDTQPGLRVTHHQGIIEGDL